MIVILNGPLGIGKTSTSWELLWRFSRAVMLDCDHLAALHPFDYYRQPDLDYAYKTFGVLLNHHAAHGYGDFVLNWVIESPLQLEKLKAELSPAKLPIRTYRLRCDPEVIAERVRRRGQPDQAFELARSRELAEILEVAARTGDLGTVIDTTHLSVKETVDAIWSDFKKD